LCKLASGVLKTDITRVDIRELRSPAEMRKLLNRKIVEQDGICVICHFEFKDCTTLYPTMKILREWEALGATIIQVTSEPSTGGAPKNDQQGWTSDGRSAVFSSIN